jgi:prevent-host-death family protein
MSYAMETVGAYEAKTHLPKLLERVLKGERITITKHGVPVTVLQPPDPERKVDTQSVILELRKFRDEHSLGGISIRDMVEEGRR